MFTKTFIVAALEHALVAGAAAFAASLSATSASTLRDLGVAAIAAAIGAAYALAKTFGTVQEIKAEAAKKGPKQR